MKQFFVRLTSTVFGLFLYAFGVVVTISANIGYAPWDIFHAGISKTTGITMGVASISTGMVILVIVLLLGEKIGLGTILNMILIGAFIDLLLAIDFIPLSSNLALSIVMLIAGLFIISIGTYFYIKSGFGAGPRDSLMVAFTRRSKLPVGVCRGIIEFSVAVIGWILGGMFGIGTIISVFAIGFCVQITFKLFKFDATQVKHETLAETYSNLISKRTKKT